MASKRPSKRGAQFYFTCQHTAPTSIRSSSFFPNSKRCCARSLRIRSKTPPSPSTVCARQSPLVLARSPGLNVPHTSPIQDMVNQIGKRSMGGLKLRLPHHANLETEVAQSAAQLILDCDRLRLQQLAMCQQHPQFLTAYRLHMHRTIKPRPHHLRYAARIVAVRLVDLRLQHRLHVPRLNADHRQSCFGESAEQPLR